jgi:hypothetical protein
MDRIPYMDMLHPGSHYAVMAIEDRVRSRRRERALVVRLRHTAEAVTPAPERGGRPTVANLVSLFLPGRFVAGEPRPQEE